MRNLAFAVLATAGFAGTPVSAATISPTGNATNVTAAIQAAIDAAPNGTVTLAAGTYPINKTLNISNGASLIGGGSDRSAVVLSLETTATDLDMQGVLNISGSADTVVSNLTVTGKNAVNGNTVYGPDVAVKMNSGLLVDCSIEDNKTKNGYRQGGGIKMTGNGTVRNCTITRCQAYNSGGNAGSGEGIWMSAGLVENCRIIDNKISYSCTDANPGGAVYIEGTGTLRGCLVAGNNNHGLASGVYVKGQGVVENCTIVGNSDYDVSGGTSGLAIDGANVVVRNNIVWGNLSYYGDAADLKFGNVSYMDNPALVNNNTRPLITNGGGNVSVDPLFADPENGDYHVGYSYCIDAGSNQGWMANAVDLGGKARIINNTVDMGCYESDAPSGFLCAMSLSSDEASDLATVTLECKYIGCPAETASSAAWTLTRQQDGHEVTASGFSTSVLLAAGVWDARLVVYGGGSAECMVPSAVSVRASKAYANENGRGEFPYDTVAKGSPSINTVLRSLGVGSTLYVAEGHYVISNGINLVDGGCTRIESIAGPERTIVRMENCPTFANDGGTYGLQLDSGSAYVSGLTLIGGRPGADYKGSLYTTRGLVKVSKSGAMVTNCVFRDQRARDRVWESGLSISAGTVVDCLFTGLEIYSSGNSQPAAGIMCIKGGLVDRVRIEDCIARMYSSALTSPGGCGEVIGIWGSGVLRNSFVTRCVSEHSAPAYIGINPSKQAGGCAENCTFVANTNLQTNVDSGATPHNYAGGVIVNSGSMTNCIVVGNWSAYGNAVSNIYNEAGAAGIGYTLVDDRAGDASFVTAENHNVTAQPGMQIFRRPEVGNYTLSGRSPAVNAGLLLNWMATSVDLAGSPRVISRVPDLGCYEAAPQGFAIRLR
ncbi:MAG: hypothetical protein IKQ17_06055 [Kiritimatiellae bacterium]|nr:hypothetical protein [Kiritimatiellia bacterium]